MALLRSMLRSAARTAVLLLAIAAPVVLPACGPPCSKAECFGPALPIPIPFGIEQLEGALRIQLGPGALDPDRRVELVNLTLGVGRIQFVAPDGSVDVEVPGQFGDTLEYTDAARDGTDRSERVCFIAEAEVGSEDFFPCDR